MNTSLPQINLMIGDYNLTPIPPKWLREFKFTSSLNSYFTVDASFFDPTFEEVEAIILERELTTTSSEGVPDRKFTFKYGLLNSEGNMLWSEDLNVGLKTCSPTISNEGMYISITTFPWQISVLSSASTTRTYYGKRSDVIQAIADEFGWKAKVVETDDSPYEQVKGKISPKKQRKSWSTGNMVLTQFIRQVLIPGSKSKVDGAADYRFDFDSDGKTVKFAPRSSNVWIKKDKPPKAFVCMFGKGQDLKGAYTQINNSVKSFTPDFKSDMLGAWGMGGALTRHYNPHTKEFKTVQLNPETVDKLLLTGPTSQVGIIDRTKAPFIGGFSQFDSDDAQSEAERNWTALFESTFEASLELFGSDYTYDIRAGDIIKIIVGLPSGNIHYSSGFWRVMEASHSITNEYIISCRLQRNYGIQGSQLKPPNKQTVASIMRTILNQIPFVPEFLIDILTKDV